jgi:hypothetical protein
MNYVDFDPYLIRQRNEQILQEVHSLRLEKRVQVNREPRGFRFVTLALRGTLPLLRRVGLAS